MGLFPPMLLPQKNSRRFVFWMLAFGLMASVSPHAHAAIADVVVDGTDSRSSAEDSEGILPNGLSWNQPLKAGDLTLSKTQAPARKKPAPTTASRTRNLPVGDIQSPRIGQQAATPPSLTGNTNSSSANLMLMQGMMSALQKAGQNPNIPRSSPVAAPIGNDIKTPVVLPNLNGKTASAKSALPQPQTEPVRQQAPRAPIFIEDDETAPLLPETEAGVEPRANAGAPTPKPTASPTPAASKPSLLGRLFDTATPAPTPTSVPTRAPQKPSGKGSSTFEALPDLLDPELTAPSPAQTSAAATVAAANAIPAISGDIKTPKATEMTEAPVLLEQLSRKTEKTAAPQDNTAKKKTSVFGEAVKETQRDATGKTKDKTTAKSCESRVERWTKNCGEAGYPESYAGEIKGETRTECPSGNTRDVWLDNTCAPSGQSDPDAKTSSWGPEFGAVSAKTTPSSSAETNKAETDKTASAKSFAPAKPEKADASCGASNGLAHEGKPVADLCDSGQASHVLGEGPWRWTCQGSQGGMTVSCAAPLATSADTETAKNKKAALTTDKTPVLEDGKCGLAANVGTDTPPDSNLCVQGIASRVNGTGPWTWACSGTNGGTASACLAPKKIDGICGSITKDGTDSMPAQDLCATGIASAVTGKGPWNWTCSGLHGGNPATCTVAPRVNAVCGMASLTGHKKAPKDDLCKAGKASNAEGSGPWTWICAGANGGAPVTCKAPVMVDGSCGGAHGSLFDAPPTSGLCTTGQSTRVTGAGPWNWSCTGLDGGATESCTASFGSKEAVLAASGLACGTAAETVAFQTPKDNLCVKGKASTVESKDKNGPWTWDCTNESGHSLHCTTPVPTEGSCGKATEAASPTPPATGLCQAGIATAVERNSDKTKWTWTCKGSLGAANKNCAASIGPMSPNATRGMSAESAKNMAPLAAPPSSVAPPSAIADEAKCGTAAGRGTREKPAADLCEVGKSSDVRGAGPWTWLCGTKSGSKILCDAPLLADGVCGSVNGSIQKTAPQTDLCASGTPTPLEGTGPWLWSCVGSGGGSSASCSVTSQSMAKIDGICGAAANAVMTTEPDANLCDSGNPSRVHGEGPWTWTCSGANGGIASTCATTRVRPQAPPPPGALVNGNCGASNGVALEEAPEEGLCTSGTASKISGNGPWNWSCLGMNGGMTVSCTAPLLPPAPIVGVCGAANGVITLTPPRSNLCAAGIASAVNGKGPWTWSCSGTNGGGAVSCVAPLAGGSPQSLSAGQGAGRMPSLVTPSLGAGSSDEAPAPKAAPVGLVTPRLMEKQLSPLESGKIPSRRFNKNAPLPREASARPDTLPAPEATEESSSESKTKPEKTVPALSPSATENGIPVAGSRLILDPELSTLSFTRGSDALGKDSLPILEKLASGLQNHANTRITLVAYAGTGGDISTREARRLSLNRALAMRDFLNSKGISSDRIDVRALGANVPSGDMDRVDIKIN